MPKIIIYSPQGSGKTQHPQALMQYFGCSTLKDNWCVGFPVPPNTLALTNDESIFDRMPSDNVYCLDEVLIDMQNKAGSAHDKATPDERGFHSQMEIWEFLLGGGTIVSVPNPQLTFRVQAGDVICRTEGTFNEYPSTSNFRNVTDYLKIIPAPWHEALNHQEIMCWVSDTNKLPSAGNHETFELIDYSERSDDGSFVFHKQKLWWKYATPLTQDEMAAITYRPIAS
jgi:hypothetical protein